jgi:predicted anti-sigma-YlaC factor YlaD
MPLSPRRAAAAAAQHTDHYALAIRPSRLHDEDSFSDDSDEEAGEQAGLSTRDITGSPVPTSSEFFSSLVITASISTIYLWGLLELLRVHVWIEAAVTIGLPVFVMVSNYQRHTEDYQRKLIALESVFNVVAVIAKVAIETETAFLNTVASYAFLVFLLAQFAYFVGFCIRKGIQEEKSWREMLKGTHYFTAAMALTVFLAVLIQRIEAGHWGGVDANTLGANGELMIWGGDVGVMLKVNYLFWTFYILLCDDMHSKLTKPSIQGYMTLNVAQLCSVGLSMLSGEFWHARMVTAVHLVVLDGVMHTHNSRHDRSLKAHGEFCTMPAHWYRNWTDLDDEQKRAADSKWTPEDDIPARGGREQAHRRPVYLTRVVPVMRWVCLAVCVACPIFSTFCGSHDFFCGMYVGATDAR